jgi:hypothetical protein
MGLSPSHPTTLETAVELPDRTLTLVGEGLPSGFPQVTPNPGQRFVAPQLSSYCRLSAGSYCEGLGSFELIDSHGTRHSPSIAVSGEGFLPAEDFPGGTSIAGALVFMVPTDTSSLTLRYVGPQGLEAFFQVE